LSSPRGPHFECLRTIFELPRNETSGDVTIEKFANAVKWFGPLKSQDETTMIDRIREIMLKEDFHVSTKAEIEHLLKEKAPGTYCLRFSSKPGAYALTYLSNAGKIVHILIEYEMERGVFTFDHKEYPSLPRFIEVVGVKIGLREPLLAQHIFHDAEGVNYITKIEEQ